MLWDVDYTLVGADGLGTRLYEVVFGEMFGRELTEVAPKAGRTDRAIVIEGLRGLGQVEHRLLHPGPGRIRICLDRFGHPPRPVQAHAGDRHDVALGRNGHVDRAGRLIGETVQFGGRMVAEYGTGPGGQ